MDINNGMENNMEVRSRRARERQREKIEATVIA